MIYDIEFAFYYALLIGFHSVTSTETKDSAIDNIKLNATTGELLLELMIKIATNENQWSKIHDLLGNITDSIFLKKVMDAETINNLFVPRNTAVFPVTTKKPKFRLLSKTVKSAAFQNLDNNYRSYSKTFTYQRVTGQPLLFDRNPKPYVAVSILAPKHGGENLKEDTSLEKELQLLKPWSHQENLKNMAAIRSRYFIQN